MGWVETNFDDVAITGITREEFQRTWPHVQRWQPTGVPKGATVYRVKELIHGCGPCALYVYGRNENGAPQPGLGVAEGWGGGATLSAGALPMGGMADAKQPQGLAAATDPVGMVTFAWGGGDQFDPVSGWGPHQTWICKVQSEGEVWTEAVHGLGWIAGTVHCALRVVFQRTVNGEDDRPEPPEPPVPPVPPEPPKPSADWLETLLRDIGEAFLEAADTYAAESL